MSNLEVVKRKEAQEKNLDRYYTGKPCKHGHEAERYTVNGGCVVCVQIKTAKRKEPLKEYSANYYKEHKQEILRKKREKYHENN